MDGRCYKGACRCWLEGCALTFPFLEDGHHAGPETLPGAIPGRTGSLAAKQHKYLHQNQGRSQAEQVLWLQNNTNIYIRIRGDPRQNRFSGCKTTQIFTSESGAIPGRTGSLAVKQHKYLHQNQGRSQAEQVL